ncbi:lipid IV(A) 3-deoxy-D-manno-octulosonic acid transferase [Shewanella sp. A14]
MNRIVYSLFLYLLFPLVVLYLAFRAIKSVDYRRRWSERFGFAKLKQTDVLIHSVSMGETLAAIPLIKQLMAAHPDYAFTVTTTSPTGSAEVVKAFGDTVQHCYLPFDFSYAVKGFLRQLQPKVCIIMETELWPNLVHFAQRQQVTLILANARLSQKSADQYAKKRRLIVPMLNKLNLITVQTQFEAKRFVDLGVAAHCIHVCGSVKFDLTIDPIKKQQANTLRVKWQRVNSPIWAAGSVHPGEFEAMLNAHKQLLNHFPDALLIMVPRHPEQFNLAAITVTQSGLTLARRSMNDEVNSQTQVLLGDTMGELVMLYGAADQAFVGGTLINNGGHNPLEPAAMGLPIYVGPNHWDFAEITQLLADAGALTCIRSADELAQELQNKFIDDNMYQSASKSALAVVEQNRGALVKQFTLINELMS